MSNPPRKKKPTPQLDEENPAGWAIEAGGGDSSPFSNLNKKSFNSKYPENIAENNNIENGLKMIQMRKKSSSKDERLGSQQQQTRKHVSGSRRIDESQNDYEQVQQYVSKREMMRTAQQQQNQQDIEDQQYYKYLKQGEAQTAVPSKRGEYEGTNRSFVNNGVKNQNTGIQRPQAQSVLAGQNLNSKPKGVDQHVSIEDVIQNQQRMTAQTPFNQTGGFDFATFHASSKFSHLGAGPAGSVTPSSMMNGGTMSFKQRQGISPPGTRGGVVETRGGSRPSTLVVENQFDDFAKISENQWRPTLTPMTTLPEVKRPEQQRATTSNFYSGGRASASQDHRRQFKSKGYDPKAKMIAQLKKDGLNISDILQYKDYAMEIDHDSMHRKFTARVKKPIQNRGHQYQGLSIFSPHAGNSSRRASESHQHYYPIETDSGAFIMKNSFMPQTAKEKLQAKREVGPMTAVKIPENLQIALNKRGDLDSFMELIQNGSQSGTRSPNEETVLFRITDLLDHKNMTKEEKEYVIKNYRLIQQKKRDFFLPQATQVPGSRQSEQRKRSSAATPQPHSSVTSPPPPTSTQIRVSNSILSPNTYHFSTKVTLARRLDPLPERPDGTLDTQEEPSAITSELVSPTSPRAYMNLLKQAKQSPEKIYLNDEKPLSLMVFRDEEVIVPPAYEHPEYKPEPIKIIEQRDFETEEDNNDVDRAILIEENFKDLIASWVGKSVHGVRDINAESPSSSEDELLEIDERKDRRMSRNFSAIKIYDLDNSFDSLTVEKKMILKMNKNDDESSLLDRERSKSPNDQDGKVIKEPYAHLKARNVFGKKTVEFNRQIQLIMHNPDSRKKATMLIDLSKDFLTHLDYSQFTIDRLPLEIFDDFLLEVDSIKLKIQQKNLLNNGHLLAKTSYYRTNGNVDEVSAKVLDFDDQTRKFIVEFRADEKTIRKQLGRLNLVFDDFDSKEVIEERRRLAKNLRRHALFKLNAERLFVQELARKYDFIKMPHAIKQNIKKRLMIDLSKFDPHKVQVLALQVEALFVFSILKSIIFSQIGDPFISRIVAQYKIEDISITGKDVKQEIADTVPAVPYYALRAYEERGGKLERMLNKDEAIKILQNYAILGKQEFIDAMQFMTDQNEELVQGTHIFDFPVSEHKYLVYLSGQEEFKGKSMDELKVKLRQFPVQMHHFIKSQRSIAKKFKDTLEGRWTESIASKVEQILNQEYKSNSGTKEILRSQLNPYVLKLFELIRLQQERNLLEKLTDTMEKYLKFLMQFAIRDSDFPKSRAWHQNDFEKLKVRMSSKPMIVIDVRVKKSIITAAQRNLDDSSDDGIMHTSVTKRKMFNYEIQTHPPLEDVWSDLNSMVDMFVSTVSRIRRIDDIVIPQLKLKRNTLAQFDKNKNTRLLQLSKMIVTLIDQMRDKPDSKVASFSRYAPYLELTFEQMILDLKFKTYQEQNFEADQQKKAAGEEGGPNLNASTINEHEIEAYIDIEISETNYAQRFSEMRQAYWDVLLNIESTSDFGMIILDSTSFKSLVSKHLEKLLKALEKHIITEFLAKMNTLYNQYDLIERKSTDKATTIDDVIMLIEFIETIQKPDELLDELEIEMEELKQRKNFIDDLYLKLDSCDFEKFLNLFSFPSRLRLLLVKRKFSLENEREILSAEMAKEKDKVLKAIIQFREQFEYFKKVGLYKPGGSLFGFDIKPEEKTIIKKKVTADDKGNKSKRGEKKNQIVSLVDDHGNQFVPQYISENAARMDKLKQDLEQTEHECEIINRREKLLNFRITKFTAVSNLKADMSPFITLWNIASNFTRVYETWLHGVFSDLDSDAMDEMIQDWIKQLTRISKTNLATYEQPLLLVNYLIRELERFKEYMPMIIAMRAKGLEKRHWGALAKQLGFENVETNTMTLAMLIEMKLYEGPKLDVIKAVCEVAMREWAIKTTLDSLEAELRCVEFTVARYKEASGTHVLKGLEELLIGFEEFTMKVVGLKANAFAKPFAERIGKVEREFRTVVDVLDEWIRTQKSWIYLEPIFSQKDLAQQMAAEATKFNSLDAFYRKEINMIRIDLNVHKYCRREHILNSLQYVNKEFENISKGLTVYLESKREHFARFYFLSNEEIIEILGQMRDPKNVQRYLNKIFEGIESLQFTPYGMIAGIFSKEEEYLVLKKQINPCETAESWLRELESEMKNAVKAVIQGAFMDFRMKDFESWIKAWQGQAVLCVLNIIFTETLTEIFELGQTKRLKDVLNQVVFEIETLTKMIRSKLDINTRTSICSLLTNRVHARDTLKNMIESDVRYASDFYWKMFMKYEYQINQPQRNLLGEFRKNGVLPGDKSSASLAKQDDLTLPSFPESKLQTPASKISTPNTNFPIPSGRSKKDNPLEGLQDLYVSMIDARRPYGYEYLGNTQRIVITPLTDRCFRALLMALHFNYGGSPEGPVGTGKTETTKDLSKCLGKQCFVFNCSSSLNYEAMSKFFKGLATSGAWSCFDEFNRIDLSVLSVISQIIIVMQGAIRENKTEVFFDDSPIKFNKECAIFITMNPQFLGRTDLPDNLKSLFRPVAMIIPDSTLISEIHLYSAGFLQAKPLARKLIRAFKLAKQQLSHQIHYEFGLRSIKIVLQIAGLMKLKASGVIEPDFKIKEGKKLKETQQDEDNNNSPLRKNIDRQNRINRKGNHQHNKAPQNNRAAYLAHMRKQESSLDSEDGMKRHRAQSIDSEDMDIADKSFFIQQENPQQGRKFEALKQEEQAVKDRTSKIPDVIYKRLQLSVHKTTRRGIEKFHSKRQTFARGRVDKMMDRRLESLEGIKDEAKQTKKLMKVLGIENEELIKDEQKIEEFIVLRAINETNLPKLHQNDTVIFKGIIDDIFPNPIKQSSKRSSLKSLLEDVVASKTVQMTDDIMERILHLYETVMIRHGVMVVGSTMTGKTTSIQLLQECLNRSRENELEEKIYEFKIKKAKKMAQDNFAKKQWQEDTFDLEEIKFMSMELNFEELKIVKSQCRNKGVATFTINPKSLTINQLMGTFDENSHDWNDGIMAHAMRTCSQDTSERRNWIVFDGPIDPEWVENLNSVLDDNKKLTLSTGESIKMTGLMTIILEAEDLSNSTPATISRCGMIYMKDDILPLKAIINQWIKKLPVFLEDQASEFDTLCNYFLPEILEKYMLPSNLIYPVTQKWAVKNFCKLMDAMINDYRSEKFSQLSTLNAATLALYNGNTPQGTNRTEEEHNNNHHGADKHATGTGQNKRPCYLQFSDVESRFQSAFRNKTMWIQNFFLFCVIWAFGSILHVNLRHDFERDIKSKIICNQDDISTIAQLKNKFLTKKTSSFANNVITPVKVNSQIAPVSSKQQTKQVAYPISEAPEQQMQPQKGPAPIYHPTLSFKEPERPPYFLCPLPTELNLFDLYFDLETNSWNTWDTLKISNRGGITNDDSQADSNSYKRFGSIFTRFIPTIETIRLGYLLEANIVCKNSTMLIGPTGCGKSWLTREVLFKQLPLVSSRFKSSTMVFSSGSNAEKAQHFIDQRLEKKRKGVFGPPFSSKYIFFIDDLMMPFKDEFGTQSANELLRQWFDFSGWFDPKTLEFKRIEDIQFVSCITIYDSQKTVISTRNEWHWTYLGCVNMDEQHFLSLFSQILDTFSVHWPSVVQGEPVKNLIRSTLELYEFFEINVKPTPNKYLYHFNIRNMFKIIYGITEIEPTYLRSEFDLAKLWIHESWRTMCDRISDQRDQKIIYKKMKDIAGKYFQIGETNQFSKNRGYPFFTHFNKGSEGLYLEVTDLSQTSAYLKKYLGEYNEIHKKQRINVVLFDFLIEFLLKVHRVIKQPFSHAILIGIEGSGKQAICQLATALANYQFHTIRFDAQYNQEDWQYDLKHLLTVAGVEMKEIVFHLKHNQIIKESFLDDLNTLVNNGEVQNVFSKEDYENIIQQVSSRLNEGKVSAKAQIQGVDTKNPQNATLALGDFSQRCRENLKVVLNFTPTGANLRNRIRDFRQIINCSTVIWMEHWPNEGYKEVAETFLPIRESAYSKADNFFSFNRDRVLEIAMKIHMEAIALAKTYFMETQHYLHITPHLFSDFLSSYKTLYVEKRLTLNELRKRYETGLLRLQSTQEQVEEFSSQLESSSPLLLDKQVDIERILERLKDEHENVGRLKEILTKEEEQLIVQREQSELIRQECEHNLSSATPELYSAISSLQSLSKNEVQEMKSLKNPPQAVKLLMEGVCLVMGVEPVKYRAKDGVTMLKDYWSAATGKNILGNPRLVEMLSAVDSTNIQAETMQSLEELTENPDFALETIARASKAGKGLFLWLQAIRNYYYVYRETMPKRDALFYAEKQMIEKEHEIKVKKEDLILLQENLEYLRASHSTLEEDIAVLQKEIDECSVKKERAGKLLTGLGGERQKWLVCSRMIEKKFLTIQGDVLLGAAFITYLSAFTQKFRERSVEKWSAIIKRHEISISEDFSFNKTFGDQIKIKEWIFNGLPGDSFSIQNAVILEKCSKQAVCIDPQYQANKWIKEQDVKDLKILNFSESSFVQSMEFAMKFGKRVLIENVGQKIDLMIYPLIKRDFQNEGGQQTLNMFGHSVDVDPNFKLFIVSELKNPRFGPDISVLTTQVNFHVTIEGLEEQMLSIVISNQKSDLEEESIKMRKEALMYIKILKQLEDDILESLSQEIEAILSDEKLIETLNTSKKTSRQIGENLGRVNRATTILMKSRGIYTPAAYRASLLYFLVSDISKIEYMYQFSLKWYIEIFTEEVKSKKHTDQDPLLDIIRNFTYTLYRKVCQSIFEKDKLLFTFLLAFRILDGEKCLDDKLYEFFLHGQQLKAADPQTNEANFAQSQAFNKDEDEDMTEEDKQKKKRDSMMLDKLSQISKLEESSKHLKEDHELKRKKKAITWISENQWSTLDKLALVPPFNKPNIVKHILSNTEQWLAYVNAKDSDNIQMPGAYLDYDPVKEEQIKKRKKQGKHNSSKQTIGLDDISEEDEENESERARRELNDDEIWNLDDEDDEPINAGGSIDDEEVAALLKTKTKRFAQPEEDKYIDDREVVADSIVTGVSDYQEIRYGSIRFEKELQTKKQQVLRDLIRFAIMRIFTPEKIVREVQRFLGSVLDPRFMEPPVFNLPQLYQETNCFSPILFIQSPNTNVLNELNILKHQINEGNLQIEYMPLGGNINEKAQALILKSALNGSWLLLENLHLVTDWIPSLEKYVQEMYKEDQKEAAKNPAMKSRKSTVISKESQVNLQLQQQLIKDRENANYPDLVGIRIHSKFRLWLSSMPVDYFPVSFLQDCIKVTLQPAQGIRQNALKLLNSTGMDVLQRCPVRQAEFRKLYFALTIFHAVVVERQRFGPLGFSAPSYQFSENDFVISSLQLQELVSKISNTYEPLPLELVRYLIGTLNYGGRIVKQQDEITLNALLDTFLSERTCSENTYRLTGADASESGIYYVPGEGDINHYKMFIGKFPVQDRPEIFGLHKNAIVQRMTNDGKSLIERAFEFEFASKEMVKASAILETNDAGFSEGGNPKDVKKADDKIASFKKRIVTIIQQLPDLLDDQLCAQLYPISYDHCFNTLITKEVQRYNMLLQVIYLSLKNTLKALEGVIHINAMLEEVYKALTYEHVPLNWYRCCYPTYKSLGLFMSNLNERVAFIRSFLVGAPPEASTSQQSQDGGVNQMLPMIKIESEEIKTYWFPGFFDQQGFLTMLLQQKARNDKVSIELLAIDYHVVKQHTIDSLSATNGCIIYGLFVEGARCTPIDENQGDLEAFTLQDQLDGYGVSIYQEMPSMHLTVINQADYDLKYNNDKYYNSPLYMIGLRERLGRMHEGDFSAFADGLITKIPLYIGASGVQGSKNTNQLRSPAFWIKRGSALLCHKED